MNREKRNYQPIKREVTEERGCLDVYLKSGTRITTYLSDIEEFHKALRSEYGHGESQGLGVVIGYRSDELDFYVFDKNDKRRLPPEINGNPLGAYPDEFKEEVE